MSRITGRIIRLERGTRRPDPRDLSTWTDGDLLAVVIPDAQSRRAFAAMPEIEQASALEEIAKGAA